MRIAIIIAALAVAQPAEACHRFSRWYYPYKQRCSVVTPSNHDWYVEITKLPPLDDRGIAIEQLKKEMAK